MPLSGKFCKKIRLDPSRIRTVRQEFLSIFRHFEQSEPSFFDISIIAKQNLSSGVNIVSVGSPSRIRIVRLISFGITTRPRSSMRLTIPVAFIYIKISLFYRFVPLVSANEGDLYFKVEFYYIAILLTKNQRSELHHADFLFLIFPNEMIIYRLAAVDEYILSRAKAVRYREEVRPLGDLLGCRPSSQGRFVHYLLPKIRVVDHALI